MKNRFFNCDSYSSEDNSSVNNGIQIAILILSAIAVIIGAIRLAYDIFGNKLRRNEYDDYENYDYDPSDIYDEDELSF